MLAEQVDALEHEPGVRRELLDVLDRRQPAAGEDLGLDELHELQVTDGDLDPVVAEELLGVRQDGVQQHATAVGQQLVGLVEEQRVPLDLERLEGADADDAVDGLVELLPTVQQHPAGALGVQLVEHLLHMNGLVLGQRETHHVDVVLLDGAPHGGPPAAADIEQRHTRLQPELGQREVDLGELRLLQRDVPAAVEIGTAVGHRRIEEQPEEFVRQVVVRLDFLEVRRQLVWHWRLCAFLDPGAIGQTIEASLTR